MERDTFNSVIFNVQTQFQLTRSRGAWRRCICMMNEHFAFQLTRSRGAWLKDNIPFIYRNDFNSHAHVERDFCRFLLFTVSELFQLTRSRGAWLICSSTTGNLLAISTHTLTWSVTLKRILFSIIAKISTHTLTWSVTMSICQLVNFTRHFNSHAHVERDLYHW